MAELKSLKSRPAENDAVSIEGLDEVRVAERLGALEVLTLIFSFYVLVALLFQATNKLSPETVQILRWMDWLVCAVSSRPLEKTISELGLD
jgi:hypothetical protein